MKLRCSVCNKKVGAIDNDATMESDDPFCGVVILCKQCSDNDKSGCHSGKLPNELIPKVPWKKENWQVIKK